MHEAELIDVLRPALENAVNAAAYARPADPAAALDFVAKYLQASGKPVGERSKSIETEWTVQGWLSTVAGVATPVADALAPLIKSLGNDDPFRALQSLADTPEGQARVERALGAAGLSGLAAAIWAGVKRLSQQGASSGAAMNEKFHADERFVMAYGPKEAFMHGLEHFIGPCNPEVASQLRREHCASADSHKEFTNDNYGLRTTSSLEYGFTTGSGVGAAPAEDPAMLESVRATYPRARAREPRSSAEFEALRLRLNGRFAEGGADAPFSREHGPTELHAAHLCARERRTHACTHAANACLPLLSAAAPRRRHGPALRQVQRGELPERIAQFGHVSLEPGSRCARAPPAVYLTR